MATPRLIESPCEVKPRLVEETRRSAEIEAIHFERNWLTDAVVRPVRVFDADVSQCAGVPSYGGHTFNDGQRCLLGVMGGCPPTQRPDNLVGFRFSR